MSEMDDLKMEAEASKVRAQFSQINEYLDGVILKINETEKRHKISSLIYLVVWLSWVASSFLPDNIHYVFTMAFIFALIHDQFCFTKMMRAYAQFRGAVDILRILGYVPPREEEGVKKKRKILSEFREMVKGWAIKKQKARDSLYQPA